MIDLRWTAQSLYSIRTMTDQNDLPILSPAEARVLGSLAEKKELTPDVYPMTVNALQSAANQKTSREPVMALETVEISRALGTLQHKELVRQQFASRVERYEHLLSHKFSLTQPQIAIVGLLLLRGPQTAHELLARAERMANGIEIDEATWGQLMAIAERYQIRLDS